MIKSVFEIVSNILGYIFDIRLFDIPMIFLYVLISGGIGYCTALITIGFPCTIYEEITKKKINDETESKITAIVAICVSVAFYYFAWIV